MKFFSSTRAKSCTDCKVKKWRVSLKESNTKKKVKALERKEVKKSKKLNNPKRLKRLAWKAFSDFIRLRDALKTTGTREIGICITCDQEVPFSSFQAGHFLGGRKGDVLFDEQYVNGQCVTCNVFLRGNYVMYTIKMIGRYGLEEVNRRIQQSKNVLKRTAQDYLDIIEEYTQKVKDL